MFAVGDDANLPLLRTLARNEGAIENVLSTEPVDFKLNAFVSKIGRNPVAQLGFKVSPEASVQMVYPLQDTAFGGSIASWVGQYGKPAGTVEMSVHGLRDGNPFEIKTSAPLPAQSLEHPQLPRLWARARVDALLEKIEREGEDAKTVEEIIRLSRKYKFVTPYTSFLAVPRALLRPRVIRPGDPVLRVHTDESIHSVVAIFPFGLTKRLRYLEAEDVWQTRFLAPDDMQDGTYSVGLVLRDHAGHTYRESKTFVIASKPPVVSIRLDNRRYHRGGTVPLKVNATASTRTLTARLEGVSPVSLRWNQKAGASTGDLQIPSDLPAGTYGLPSSPRMLPTTSEPRRCKLKYFPDPSFAKSGRILWPYCAGLLLVPAIVLGARATSPWRIAESGSAIEAALYRWMPMPVSKVFGLRPPREATPLLSELIKRQPSAELYSLRALNEEASLDFVASEADWKKYAEVRAGSHPGGVVSRRFLPPAPSSRG